MKIKTLSFIAGAFALSLTTTPFIAQAQMGDNPPPPPEHEMMEKGPFSKLNLTDAQKAKMKQIDQSTRTKIEAVLTTEQKSKLKALEEKRKADHQARKNNGETPEGKGKEKGKNIQDPFASLNLSDAQKKSIKTIRESTKTQMEAVLNAEQKTKLEKMKKAMHSHKPENKKPQ